MATYSPKQLLNDYANGRMTPEMAVGHSLQHIDKLYEAQTTANADQHAAQAKVDALFERVNTLQVAVDRLTAIIEKFRVKRKPGDPKQPKPDQPW